MTNDQFRELTHLAIVTRDGTFAYRTPRALVTPLLRAGYVVERAPKDEHYRVTAEGLRALEKEQAS